MRAVPRDGGTVNRVMGDGIMALFGAPLAHEDHAARTCHAALRMHESVKKYADEVRRSHAAVIQIKGERVREHLVTARAMYREMDMQFGLEQAEAAMREMA